MTSRLWGLHNNRPELDIVPRGFVSIGWEALGDLSQVSGDREAFKKAFRRAYPDYKEQAVPVAAGVLYRFVHAMQLGDLVVYPHRPDSTVAIGRVASDYRWDQHGDEHPHRRDVQWLATEIPRQEFSQAALYEIGSAVTLFQVRRYAHEFLKRISDGAKTPAIVNLEPVDEADVAEDAPNAERIEDWTRDYIIKALLSEMSGQEFEHFTADLLRAMGYQARVTQVSGDGGVDVVAYRDSLGLEPPIIKVQCKRTLVTQGSQTVQQLTGALAPGGGELGLFVTLGSFSADAKHIERTRQDVRLLGGKELIDLIFDNYATLPQKWQRILPMRQVYVIDRDPETG
jgi:restriction system protein